MSGIEFVHPGGEVSKLMDAATFQSEGWLQEVNRRLLHPMGLAIAVTRADDGVVALGLIFDWRGDTFPDSDDLEGGRFGENQIDAEFCQRAADFDAEWARRAAMREAHLGYNVQPADTPAETDSEGVGT